MSKSSAPLKNVEIFFFEPVPKPRGWKKIFSYFGVGPDGIVYIPGKVFNSYAILAATLDGQPVILAEADIQLVSADWLIAEYPRKRTNIESVVSRIRQWVRDKTAVPLQSN